MSQETWKPIPGVPGYEASDQGRIRSFMRDPNGKVLKACKSTGGYLTVAPYVNGRNEPRRVHHLVLLAFVGPRPAGHVGCHGNDIADDNRASNLRWDTPAANVAERKARRRPRKGNVLTLAEVRGIYEDQRRPFRQIAADYGVSIRTVYAIKRGLKWQSITSHEPVGQLRECEPKPLERYALAAALRAEYVPKQVTCVALAAKYGVTEWIAREILVGRTWREDKANSASIGPASQAA